MSVLVLDKRKRPLMPCSEKRARKLLESGRARVHRLMPFCIRLTDRVIESSVLQPLRVSIDPGSKTTGLAVSRIEESIDAQGVIEPVMHICFLMELAHRGQAIKAALTARAAMRRRRRGNLRYRAPRFLNRGNQKPGWLAPSLQHRVDTTCAWVDRIRRMAPITHLAQELVSFDMQKMQAQDEGGDIAGVEYQQGTLQGYEVREFLLEKWGRECSYCAEKNVPLQIEHIHPKARGGSNRVSNLCLACEKCNRAKGALPVEVFLAKQPETLKRIIAQAKRPLKDAAAVNASRWALFNALKTTGLPVAAASGGQTKFNRSRLGIIKTHALDAACVGNVHDVKRINAPALQVKCTGRGSRCKTRLNKYGFPRTYLTAQKTAFGFKTGDMVMASVPKGVKAGVHKGRVAIRLTGNFNIQPGSGAATVQGISHQHCRITQRADGYGYSQTVAPNKKGMRDKGCASHTALSITGLMARVSRATR